MRLKVEAAIRKFNIVVKPGQIWADNDSRHMAPRHVKVLEVHPAGYAMVEGNGRRTKIRLDRFRPTTTGYRLVQDVP